MENLGNVDVGQPLNRLHACSRAQCSPARGLHQKRAAKLIEPIHRRAYPGTEERVAAAQMMVQERKRRANGEGVKPKCYLRQLHGKRVLVDAVDTALQHHAPDNVPVFEMFVDVGPAVLVGLVG